MKPLTLVLVGVMAAGIVSSPLMADPLATKIGTVPVDIFHAMSGNFSAAKGYTNNLSLLVPAEKINAGYRTRAGSAPAALPPKALAVPFGSIAPHSSFSPVPMFDSTTFPPLRAVPPATR